MSGSEHEENVVLPRTENGSSAGGESANQNSEAGGGVEIEGGESGEKVDAPSGHDEVGSLPMSVLDCPICLNLMCQPVTTPCGHSFCRTCLVSSLRKNKKQCPSCRSVCHIQAETHSESILLVNIARACFPAVYEKRLAEVEAEKEGWELTLPIFFFNDTLFPFSPLALHLFEPRYRVMINRIVNASRKFAYLPSFNGYEARVGEIGVIAELQNVEFLPDGRAHLQASCRERYKILEHWVEDGTQGLHWCKVELLPDEAEGEEEGAEALKREAEECGRLFEGMMARVGLLSDIEASHGSRPEEPQKLSFWLSSVLPIPYEFKHSLLTTRSTRDRLGACRRLMEESLATPAPTPESP